MFCKPIEQLNDNTIFCFDWFYKKSVNDTENIFFFLKVPEELKGLCFQV